MGYRVSQWKQGREHVRGNLSSRMVELVGWCLPGLDWWRGENSCELWSCLCMCLCACEPVSLSLGAVGCHEAVTLASIMTGEGGRCSHSFVWVWCRTGGKMTQVKSSEVNIIQEGIDRRETWIPEWGRSISLMWWMQSKYLLRHTHTLCTVVWKQHQMGRMSSASVCSIFIWTLMFSEKNQYFQSHNI